MEVRVKERLVGAIALVAIVVLAVPALLTGERTPPAPAAPSDPTQPRTEVVELNGPERFPIPRPQAPADPAAGAAAAPAAAPALDTATPAATSPAPATSVPAAEPPVAVPGANSPPRASSSPAPTPAAHAAGAAPAGEAWIVQLGSFASRDNAEHLSAALRAKGYSAFVAEYHGSGRVLYRVRVGPEQDRGRAEAIAARLAREGHRGSVAPAP